MNNIFYNATFSFRTCVALYEKNFVSYVAKYPPSPEDIDEEKKYVQILQCILNELNRYYKILNNEDSFLITFRISAYISQISNMNLPMSSKVYKLLLKIDQKINNRV